MRESRSPVLIPSTTELSTSPGVIFLDMQGCVIIVAFKFVTKNRVPNLIDSQKTYYKILVIHNFFVAYGRSQEIEDGVVPELKDSISDTDEMHTILYYLITY